jgi:hypothetical protein
MAFDRSYDEADGAGEVKPELHLHHGRTGGDAHAAKAEPTETRSREECYEALRAAVGGPEHDDDNQHKASDAPEGNSGWDTVDAEKRPALDSLRVSPERRTHILDGDTYGGGHRHGTGKPGKSEFPASWSDEKIISSMLDVASRPDRPPKHQQYKDRWVTRGIRDDVEVVAVIARDGCIWTGWPQSGPGVVRNPREK